MSRPNITEMSVTCVPLKDTISQMSVSQKGIIHCNYLAQHSSQVHVFTLSHDTITHSARMGAYEQTLNQLPNQSNNQKLQVVWAKGSMNSPS